MNTTTVPAITTAGDTARARRTDPATSHLAADKSGKGLSALRVAVLRLVGGFEDGLTGSAINGIYQARHTVWGDVYPKCHPDSPRKRAGELADGGFLDVVEHRAGMFGSQESVYRVSPDGRKYLETVD